jgi:hypothetical protein
MGTKPLRRSTSPFQALLTTILIPSWKRWKTTPNTDIYLRDLKATVRSPCTHKGGATVPTGTDLFGDDKVRILGADVVR